jgi:aspartyl-tRNA(Asn)/glutamyl-tRNA(Gln) amidotransferase subunit A
LIAPLSELAAALGSARTTSEGLVEECLTRIEDRNGEGARTFIEVDADGARRAARAMDALRRAGAEPSPYAGIPVSVKDLFDVRGQITRAGSRALDRPPAERDAGAVARWRRAGLVVIGRTNMTEFAFSGLGINPHYGTPANPWGRERHRIPGGSSSGAAVSIADGMAHGALGTDTGGSCLIPAALCGVVGFKPTQARVPRDGVVPLAPSLDSVGVLGRTVACCAALTAMLCDQEPSELRPLARPVRLGVPRNYLFDDLDSDVSAAFARAIRRLEDAGADLVDVELPELDEISETKSGGGIVAAEAFAWHRDLIAEHQADYDPRVLCRIRRGERLSARDLPALRAWRKGIIDHVQRTLEHFDAIACPTVPLVAPPLDALADDKEYARVNLLMLRNPTVVDLIDGCTVSVPIHDNGEPPTGLMVAGLADEDDRILRIASWIEARVCSS